MAEMSTMYVRIVSSLLLLLIRVPQAIIKQFGKYYNSKIDISHTAISNRHICKIMVKGKQLMYDKQQSGCKYISLLFSYLYRWAQNRIHPSNNTRRNNTKMVTRGLAGPSTCPQMYVNSVDVYLYNINRVSDKWYIQGKECLLSASEGKHESHSGLSCQQLTATSCKTVQ